MKQSNNQQEIGWLHKDVNTLLMHYQFIVETTVSKFIARGFFQPGEKEELVQEINLLLLEKKMKKIRAQYNGSVYLRTYFSKITYNLCLELIRRQQRQPHILEIPDSLEGTDEETRSRLSLSDFSVLEELAIKDELLRFEAILKSLYPQREKKKFSLKLLVRIILVQPDIEMFTKPETRSEIELIRKHFFKNYDTLSDKEVFSIAVQLFNKLENKNSAGDSLRKWTQMLADRIINLLNGEPPVSNHDGNSFKILLQLYFEKEEGEKC